MYFPFFLFPMWLRVRLKYVPYRTGLRPYCARTSCALLGWPRGRKKMMKRGKAAICWGHESRALRRGRIKDALRLWDRAENLIEKSSCSQPCCRWSPFASYRCLWRSPMAFTPDRQPVRTCHEPQGVAHALLSLAARSPTRQERSHEHSAPAACFWRHPLSATIHGGRSVVEPHPPANHASDNEAASLALALLPGSQATCVNPIVPLAVGPLWGEGLVIQHLGPRCLQISSHTGRIVSSDSWFRVLLAWGRTAGDMSRSTRWKRTLLRSDSGLRYRLPRRQRRRRWSEARIGCRRSVERLQPTWAVPVLVCLIRTLLLGLDPEMISGRPAKSEWASK